MPTGGGPGTRRALGGCAVLLCGVLALSATARPLPKNRPLSAETQHAITCGVEMEARGDAAWGVLEERFVAGTITAEELSQLRVRWAATMDPRHPASGATLQLMEAGVDTRTAVLVPQAIDRGDLEGLEAALDGAPSLPVEVQLLHVGTLWALGREGKAALVYRQVLEADSLLAYYDALLDEWLRGRLAEIGAGGTPAFAPSDPDRAEALRQNLRGRGPGGLFLLEVLDPPEEAEILGVPLASLDRDLVTEVMGSQRVDLYFCYERNGGVDKLDPGTLTVEFGVGSYGAVEFCSVLPGADLRPPEFRDCCCQAVEKLRFPAPEGGGRATVRRSLSFPMKRK